MPLLTIRLPDGATLTAALRRLGLVLGDVDAEYGLVQLDPAQGLYALRVSEAAAARLAVEDGPGVGVFADPRIEPAEPDQPG
ncbi:hypothetical protein [Nocardia jejuensis]|uniref:hypothetical protein n=1 Tax=Nocardia jejuensis TaxID=328049 RepID=UPI00082BE646|nr:hypothetical protein [Nocardia jejuensis]